MLGLLFLELVEERNEQKSAIETLSNNYQTIFFGHFFLKTVQFVLLYTYCDKLLNDELIEVKKP